MDLDLDIDKDFVFTTDKNGCLRGGGFKIESHLLNETMNNKDVQTGGNVNIVNSFKNLVVPAGLFYAQKKVQKNKSIHYEYKDEELTEELYDKLLNMVDPDNKKLHARKSKSKKEKRKRNSRKVKK
jgi:hypothetical protein|tara:strand:- start:30 stop:407 length:378 start_codon:yes stop_codon:yes gene_type:complete